MNIYIGHRHYWGYGYLSVRNSMGEVEFVKNAVCLNSTCRKHKIWFDNKWWDTIEFKFPSNIFIHSEYL